MPRKKPLDPWSGDINTKIPIRPTGIKKSEREHVAQIMEPEITLLPGWMQRAIEHYAVHREPAKAAESVGREVTEFNGYFQQRAVREIINNKIEEHDKALAARLAEARILGVEFLDQHLVKTVKVAADKGDSKPIELGYERIGIRRDGNFMTQQQASPQSRPMVYRVLEQTVTRTEQVTQREVTAGPAENLRPSKSANDEVLDY